jgi:rhamnogalacturonan acetylesterase
MLLLVIIALGLLQLTTAAKIYLAGDSTMARGNGKIEGWGQYLQPMMTLPVLNRAIGGRSSRSYTVEGRFNEIAQLVQPGDYVVIEFGHNDGGSLAKNDNGRTACGGSGKETCQSTFKGTKVTVQTFPTYMINAGKLLAGKGANVVFSSMTPNNIFEGKMDGSYKPGRFTDFARQAAKAVGGKATFVDHGSYTAKEFQRVGREKVNQFFAQDHTHTSPAGAKVVAEAFVKAVIAANNPLKAYVKG